MSSRKQAPDQLLWENGAGMEDNRKRWVSRAAKGMIHCHSQPRPEEFSSEQQQWDRSFNARTLSLEMFYCPRQAMEIFCENQEARLEASSQEHPDRDPNHMRVVCNIRNIKQNLDKYVKGWQGKNQRKNFLMSMLDTDLEARFLPDFAISEINDRLKEHGVPDALLYGGDQGSSVLQHSFEVVLSNPLVVSDKHQPEAEGGFQLLDRRQVARMYEDNDPDGVPGLRVQDALEFINDPSRKDFCMSPQASYYKYLKEVNLQKSPLSVLVRKIAEGEIPKDGNISKAVHSALQTSFLNWRMGISEITPEVRSDGGTFLQEHFGRVAFYLQRDVQGGKHQSGMLPEYRKTIRKAAQGGNNPGAHLNPATGKPNPKETLWFNATRVGFFSGAAVQSTSPKKSQVAQELRLQQQKSRLQASADKSRE